VCGITSTDPLFILQVTPVQQQAATPEQTMDVAVGPQPAAVLNSVPAEMRAPGHKVPPQSAVEGQPEDAQPSAAVSEVMQQVSTAAMPEQAPADSALAASAPGARRAGRKRSSAPGKSVAAQSTELADPGAVMLEQTAADPEFTAPVSDACNAGRRQSALPTKPKPTRLPGADTQKPATIRTRRQTVAALRPASAGKSCAFSRCISAAFHAPSKFSILARRFDGQGAWVGQQNCRWQHVSSCQ